MKIPLVLKKKNPRTHFQNNVHDKRKLIPPQCKARFFLDLVNIAMSRSLMTLKEMHLEDYFLVLYALPC